MANATPAILAQFTVNGEPIGPSFPIICSSTEDAYHNEETLETVRVWGRQHAPQILAGQTLAQLVIIDRCGSHALYDATPYAYETIGATIERWHLVQCDSLPPGIIECAECGTLTTEGEEGTVNGAPACTVCVEESHTCPDCNEQFTAESLTETTSGDVCGDCLQSYFHCPVIEEYVSQEDRVEIFGGGVWHCGRVHTTLSRDGAERLLQDGDLWLDYDGDFTADQGNDANASDDGDDSDQGPGHKYGYHTDANSTLGHTMPRTKYRHGAELEYKGQNPDRYELARAMGNHAILTEDGTVSGEIVSVCLTIGQLRKRMATIASALHVTRNDAKTGLHLHTDRRALTPYQWYRLTRYTEQHADLLSIIAGRNDHEFGSLDNVVAKDWPRFAQVWKQSNGARYVGWNFTPKTVEFRCCRASKNPTRILARIGMLQRLLAIGRLPDSAKPNATELRGWMAQDRHIRETTGWEVNDWSYRTASIILPMASDLAPWERITDAERYGARLLSVQLQASEQHLATLQQTETAYVRKYWDAKPRTMARLLASIGQRIAREGITVEQLRVDRLADRLAPYMAPAN